MRRILCTPTCLVLVLALLALPPTQQALSDESPLPTDGIDDPAPGPLALPARLAGPDGRELIRSVTLESGGQGSGGLSVVASYEDPESGRPVVWGVRICAFDRPGAAYQVLHSYLKPNRSRAPPHPSWDQEWERLYEARGILLRHMDMRRSASFHIGVVRQCLVVVTSRRGSALGDSADLRIEDLDAVGRSLALRAFQTIEEAEPALRPMKAAFAQRLSVDHEFVHADRQSRPVVRMTPGPDFGAGQIRFDVFAGSRGRRAYATADELARKPLAVIEFPKETDPGLKAPGDADPTGAAIRVFRVIEGDVLAIEELRLAAGARGSQVVKSP